MTGHGGDIHRASRETGIPAVELIDFSASINPLGVPDTVSGAIREGIGLLVHYPEPHAERLANHIAGRLNVAPETVLCGNGSTELIYLLVRALAPRRVLVPTPTFSEYERACAVSRGTTIVRHSLSEERGFVIEADGFIKAMAGCDMAFLCNPNNPTGRLLDREAVMAAARAAERLSCLLVVDEAFIDFTPEHSVVREVGANAHLIVLRSLTKFYALPGLRIGYGVLPRALVGPVMEHKEPWTVNTLAQLAATAALDDAAYCEKTMTAIAEGRAYLEKGFRSHGIDFAPSAANFYLLKLPRASELAGALKQKGILVRDCSNFPGLDGSYIRVAVRSLSENSRLLKELTAVCAA